MQAAYSQNQGVQEQHLQAKPLLDLPDLLDLLDLWAPLSHACAQTQMELETQAQMMQMIARSERLCESVQTCIPAFGSDPYAELRSEVLTGVNADISISTCSFVEASYRTLTWGFYYIEKKSTTPSLFQNEFYLSEISLNLYLSLSFITKCTY